MPVRSNSGQEGWKDRRAEYRALMRDGRPAEAAEIAMEQGRTYRELWAGFKAYTTARQLGDVDMVAGRPQDALKRYRKAEEAAKTHINGRFGVGKVIEQQFRRMIRRKMREASKAIADARRNRRQD